MSHNKYCDKVSCRTLLKTFKHQFIDPSSKTYYIMVHVDVIFAYKWWLCNPGMCDDKTWVNMTWGNYIPHVCQHLHQPPHPPWHHSLSLLLFTNILKTYGEPLGTSVSHLRALVSIQNMQVQRLCRSIDWNMPFKPVTKDCKVQHWPFYWVLLYLGKWWTLYAKWETGRYLSLSKSFQFYYWSIFHTNVCTRDVLLYWQSCGLVALQFMIQMGNFPMGDWNISLFLMMCTDERAWKQVYRTVHRFCQTWNWILFCSWSGLTRPVFFSYCHLVMI